MSKDRAEPTPEALADVDQGRGPTAKAEWDKAVGSGVYSQTELVVRLLVSGLSFYLYNEVSFYTLDSVHPITHAVGNTIKRVILILFSVVRFGTPMTFQSALGSTIVDTERQSAL